jgi:hypothetical protein
MAFGKKVVREFKGFLWSSKPEDSLCNSQKVVGVDHRSLPCEAKTSLAIIDFTPFAGLPSAYCSNAGRLGRSRFQIRTLLRN